MEYGIEFGFYVTVFFFVQFPNFPLYYQAFGSVIAIFFWLLKSLIDKKWVYQHYPWVWWILALNGWIWLTMIWSVDPGKTMLYNIVFTNGSIFMVLLSSSFHKKGQVVRIVTFITLLSAYFAFKAIMPTLPTFLKSFQSSSSLADKVLYRTEGLERIKSSMGDANSVGGLYALLIALLLPLLLYAFRTMGQKKIHWGFQVLIFIGKSLLQIIGWGIIALFFITLLMSASRGAMVGLVGSLIIIFLLHNHWASNLIFGLLLGTGFMFPTFRYTLYSIYTGIVDETRYVIFQNAWELFKMVPFTGIGLGNFNKAYDYYFHGNCNHAHNIYLNTAVELGLPGLILFTVLGFSFIYYGAIYAKRQKDPFFYGINVSLVAVVFGFLVRCLVDYTI